LFGYAANPGHYPYCACSRYSNNRQGGCEHGKNWSTKTLETEVKNLIRLLEDDELWKSTVTEQIRVERERLRNPEKEAEAWQRLIGDIDQKRDRMIDMATDATILKKDVRVKLPELNKQKKEAQQELARVMDRRQQEKGLDDLEAVILKDPEVPYVQILWPEQ
jgi:hypothetical protein